MMRHQALEKAAKEKALAKEPAASSGAPIQSARERTESPVPTGPAGFDCAAVMTVEQASLSRFADAFGALLETLREASVYGPNPELSAKFDALREELSGDYALLRDDLAPLIEPAAPTDSLGFDFHGLWSDPFARLIRPETLEEALQMPSTLTASDAVRAGRALDRFWKQIGQGTPVGSSCE